ncbi:MAG: site-specific integrase [Bdellovibrionaceae bacterium]|nr:site-specific integrase [Pseudobdellovibrionaceae bacterium]
MSGVTPHYGKWRARWTDHEGKRQSEVFDDKKDAELALMKHKLEVREIKRGLRAPAARGKRFSEIADHWLQNRAPFKRSQKDDESIIRNHLRPHFGKMRLMDIKTPQVADFIRTKSYLNKKTIHNILTLMTSMLNEARDMGWIEQPAKIKKPKISKRGDNYRFLKTDEEINRLLEAARAEGPMVRLIYLCASGTGMRQGELAGLKRTDVDFARRTICVQRSFNGPTKSGHIRYIPILDVIYDDLKHWIESHNNEFVFFNNAGNMLQPSARIFQEVFKRVLQRAGFDNILWNGRRKGYIVFHDLRHTFASHWVMGGGDIFKLKEILGHASIDMTMRYAHLAPHAFTADLSRLSFGVKKASLRLVQT